MQTSGDTVEREERGQADGPKNEKQVVNENNNNQDKPKVLLEMPPQRVQSANPPSQQLLLHKVPVGFPVPNNLMESIETLIFINDALTSLISDLPGGALIDATPLNQVDSHHARTAVVLTFDNDQTKNRVLRAARERENDSKIPAEKKSYFTAMPRRSRPRPTTHTDNELQDMRAEAIKTQESARSKAKKSSKVKPDATPAASKLKYSHLTAAAKRRRENNGSVGYPDPVPARASKRSKKVHQENGGTGGSVNAASMPVAGISSEIPSESLSTLVQVISSIIPRSQIDALSTPVTVDPNPHPNVDDTPVPRTNDEETGKRDLEESFKDTTLVERRQQTDELRDTMGPRAGPAGLRNSPLNAGREIHEVMRPRSGPSDLRNCKLNWGEDIREQMRLRSQSNPSDLRYSRLQPDRDLRELMRPRPPRETEPETVSERLVNQLEESINKKAEELDSGLKTRDIAIKRLKACIAEDESKEEESYDSNVITDGYDTTEEGEVKPSEDELTNVHYSETDQTDGTPIPGPSRPRSDQTKVPGPPTKNKTQVEKPTKKKPSPIKYPEATDREDNDEDVPLSRLTTPKRPKSRARQDLRNKLNKVPVFSKPKLNSDTTPLSSRLSRDLPGPWMAGCAPKCGTEHRHRPFIAGGTPAFAAFIRT